MPPKRGRGRGRGRGKGGGNKAQDIPLAVEERPQEKMNMMTVMSVPVTERDEERVECRLCGQDMAFREFRLHNMGQHSNVATTVDDPTVLDHKFFERRLRELARFSKVTWFKCPMGSCPSRYKSALGLAYHLDTCGKTQEEVDAVLVACDFCGEKMKKTNLSWHKKSHEVQKAKRSSEVTLNANKEILKAPRAQRKSAIKAIKVMERVDPLELDDDGDEGKPKKTRTKKDSNVDDEWESFEIINFGSAKNIPGRKSNGKNSGAPGTKQEFANAAVNFLNHLSRGVAWDPPARCLIEPFPEVVLNSWTSVRPEDAPNYLPTSQYSVQFRTQVEFYKRSGTALKIGRPTEPSGLMETDFRRLPCFAGELVDNAEGNLVYNCGGPILGLSWHPSGKLLAVSTGRDIMEDLNYKVKTERKFCVQIYSHFYSKDNIKSIEKGTVVNALTLKLLICGDYGYATNLQWNSYWPTFWEEYDSAESKFSDSIKDSNFVVGNLACSHEDGTIRIYSISVKDLHSAHDIHTDSSIHSVLPMFQKVPEVCLKMDDSVYPSTGQICTFDWHEKNRFLIAGYCSGVVAIFDLETKSRLLRSVIEEDEQKYTCIFPFWTFQAHVAPVTGVHFDPESPRFFITASKDRFLKVWDMDFRKEVESRKVGLVVDTCWIRGWIHIAVAVDAAISNLSSQNNFVRFYSIGSTQGRPNCAECMDITSLTFHNGITIQATEYGNITASYFDNYWRECDYDRNKKKSNVVNICKVILDQTSFEPVKSEDFPPTDRKSYCPFDFNLEEPRVILQFTKERSKGTTLLEPGEQYFENGVRFLPFLRINKVRWAPQGGYFAAGYRNGLLTLVPTNFSILYG